MHKITVAALLVSITFNWIKPSQATHQHPPPPPELVADIYENAPDVVKAALANVGLMRQTQQSSRGYSYVTVPSSSQQQSVYSPPQGPPHQHNGGYQSAPSSPPSSSRQPPQPQQYAVLPAPSVPRPTSRPQYSRIFFPSQTFRETQGNLFQEQHSTQEHITKETSHPRNFVVPSIPSQLQRPPTESQSYSLYSQESMISPQFHRGATTTATSVPHQEPQTVLHSPPVTSRQSSHSFQQPSYEYGGFVPITSVFTGSPRSVQKTASFATDSGSKSVPVQTNSGYLRSYARGKSLGDFQQSSQSQFSPEDNAISSSQLNFDHTYDVGRILEDTVESVSVNCAGSKDLGWCDFSDDYPSTLIGNIVKHCSDIVDRMYVETPDNLIDVHQAFASEHKTNFTINNARERGSHTSWSWAAYKPHYKSLCDSDRRILRPGFARDINGRWFVIVQTNRYHQRVPAEICRAPGSQCQNLAECGINAQCIQRYTHALLMSVDPNKQDACPMMRLYRFPSSCTCDVSTNIEK